MEQPLSSTPPSSASTAASTLVRHFPVEVRDAFDRFRAGRSPADADIVVLAVVNDHMPNKVAGATATPIDPTRLIEDLGFDSIAITEMVFFLEDLFQVRIANEEILRVRTVGELRSFLREKLGASAPTSRA
ncbi:MAG: acyl carrier protein [Opitutus sp.]